MKKALISFFLIVTLTLSIPIIEIKADNRTISEPSDLYGLSALLMDADTGEVLFEKNGDAAMAVASTTKILTCLIAVEEGNLDDIVTISANAASKPNVQMNVKEGEQYVLSDLLKGMMLESYNDISVAIAEHIAGSEESFAELMNHRAKEIGCKNSYFITPNGLDSEVNGIENQSTAYDMGLIMSTAVKNGDFLEITQTREWTICEINGNRTVTATNKNRMLWEFEGMLSGKTGYTSRAGYCYVGAAKRDDRTFVVVTLTAGYPPNKNFKWTDAKNMLNYGFENYHYQEIDYLGVPIPESVPVKNGSISSLPIQLPEIEPILLRDDETYTGYIYLYPKADAPIAQQDILGRIEIYRNDDKMDEKYILAIDNVDKSSLWYQICQKIRYFFDKIF